MSKEDRDREKRKLDYIHHENELLSRMIYYLHEFSSRLSMDLSTEVLSSRFGRRYDDVSDDVMTTF